MSARTTTPVALATVACALLAAGCGGSKVSKSEVEKQIQSGFARSGFKAPVRSVKCPGDLDAKAGKSELCILTYKSGHALEVRATVKGTSGDKAHLGFVVTKRLK